MSYYYQIKEAVCAECKSILVIGKGDGIIPAILNEIFRGREVKIDTFDFDPSLHPTYVGNVRECYYFFTCL